MHEAFVCPQNDKTRVGFIIFYIQLDDSSKLKTTIG